MAIPTRSPYTVIGAGIHGLSTAYHLALQLKATGKGDGRDCNFYMPAPVPSAIRIGSDAKACMPPRALCLQRTSQW